MIINDTERLEKNAASQIREAGQEKFLLSCENEVKDRIHVARIGNIGQQLGRPMLPEEFEKRLKRLNTNLEFEVIEENKTHKRMSIVDQRGKTPVCVYENSLMPERSIPRLREMEVPDPGFTHVNRKDFDKNPNNLKPGWRKVTIPWGEKKRGWRTVLVRLIQAGVITLTQAEAEFGADTTPEWSQHTGKGAYTTPF